MILQGWTLILQIVSSGYSILVLQLGYDYLCTTYFQSYR